MKKKKKNIILEETMIPRVITKSIQVTAAFNAAGTVRVWFSSPSLEIEQVLDTCDCD
jgi:hypothetical protein